MQIKLMTLPLLASEPQTEELNHFLRSHKVVDIKKELALLDGNHVWAFCVSYIPSAPSSDGGFTPEKGKLRKIDYKDVLDPETFDIFSQMRKIRKQIADSEAIPAYAVFTDAELAEIAKLPTLSCEEMLKIPGIGKKKVEKYGNAICQHMQDETSGTLD